MSEALWGLAEEEAAELPQIRPPRYGTRPSPAPPKKVCDVI